MKTLHRIAFSLVSLLALASAGAAQARSLPRPLGKLKSCNQYYGAKGIMESDAQGEKAEQELGEAIASVGKYSNSCKDYKEQPSQSSEELQRLTSEGSDVLEKSDSARKVFDEAEQVIQRTQRAIQYLGENGSCFKALQKLSDGLAKQAQELNSESSRLASCLGVKRNCAQPDHHALRPDCPPATSSEWDTNKCQWACWPLAQPR